MKLTKNEKNKLQILISDMFAQASLIEMGAVDTRDKLNAKINDVSIAVEAAEIIPEPIEHEFETYA